MNSFEFWSHMQQHGQMSRLGWYTWGALPAMAVAAGGYLLMLFALRRKGSPPLIFFWLLLASLPPLLVFPSFYSTVSLELALYSIGFPLPPTPQGFSLSSARQLGVALDTLALGGMLGSVLAMVIMAAGSLVGELPVASPMAQGISRSITQAMTQVLAPRRAGAGAGGKHGVVRVTQGSATGSQFAVRSGTIGKQEADIIITDTVVSRKHARFDVSGGAVLLWDEGSTNGTYVQRGSQQFELNNDSLELKQGDTIFLGSPQQSNAVALVYEKS